MVTALHLLYKFNTCSALCLSDTHTEKLLPHGAAEEGGSHELFLCERSDNDVQSYPSLILGGSVCGLACAFLYISEWQHMVVIEAYFRQLLPQMHDLRTVSLATVFFPILVHQTFGLRGSNLFIVKEHNSLLSCLSIIHSLQSALDLEQVVNAPSTHVLPSQ